jgi:hypothetical protein
MPRPRTKMRLGELRRHVETHRRLRPASAVLRQYGLDALQVFNVPLSGSTWRYVEQVGFAGQRFGYRDFGSQQVDPAGNSGPAVNPPETARSPESVVRMVSRSE